MAQCVTCKHTNVATATFCINCGTKLLPLASIQTNDPEVFCMNCGNKILATACFCRFCGTPQHNVTKPNPPKPSPPTVSIKPLPPTPVSPSAFQNLPKSTPILAPVPKRSLPPVLNRYKPNHPDSMAHHESNPSTSDHTFTNSNVDETPICRSTYLKKAEQIETEKKEKDVNRVKMYKDAKSVWPKSNRKASVTNLIASKSREVKFKLSQKYDFSQSPPPTSKSLPTSESAIVLHSDKKSDQEKTAQENQMKAEEERKKSELEEAEYVKQRRKSHFKKIEEGRYRFGPKIQSVYQHQPTSFKVCQFALSGSTTERYEKKKYTAYEIQVVWKNCRWTIFRRFNQFYDWDSKLKKKTKIKLVISLPPKQIRGSLKESTVEKRKSELTAYLQGVEDQQLEFLNDPDHEQLMIRFFAPLQVGDIKIPGQKMPFKVKLL